MKTSDLAAPDGPSLNIWVVRDFEPLPIDAGSPRLMRSGQLCRALVARGHQVTWISSDFDHYGKRKRAGGRRRVEVQARYTIEILPSLGYQKNVSAKRILHNMLFARNLQRFAANHSNPPDVIVTDIPTTETAKVVTDLARRWGIPSVLSIRDLWPDSFVNLLPAPLRLPGRLMLGGMDKAAKAACRDASVLIGISEGYLDWGLAKAGRPRRSSDYVIPLGYEQGKDAAVDDPDANAFFKSLGLTPADRVVSFIGSWGRTHDLETVARAAELASTQQDIKFVVAGSGEMSASLDARLAAVPAIVTPGWLNQSQMNWLLGRSDVGLMPYGADAPQGMPNKLFQHMAAGAYQVSTLQGEAARLLEQTGTGTTCLPADAAGMAAAILDALAHPDPAKRRQEIRQVFAENFDVGLIYSRFAQIIEDLGSMGAASKS